MLHVSRYIHTSLSCTITYFHIQLQLFSRGYTSFFYIHFSSTSCFHAASVFLASTQLKSPHSHSYTSHFHSSLTTQYFRKLLGTAPLRSSSSLTQLSHTHTHTHSHIHLHCHTHSLLYSPTPSHFSHASSSPLTLLILNSLLLNILTQLPPLHHHCCAHSQSLAWLTLKTQHKSHGSS